MSELAWKILAILLDRGDNVRTHIAGWHLGKLLGGDAASIQAAHVLHGGRHTQNKYERAMRELVGLGLIEEMSDLGERWRLVVKEEKQG